jgi:hypothetical protein
MTPHLVVPELRSIYAVTSGWPEWARHLILGLLVAVQERWIHKRVVDAVDSAVKDVELSLPPSGVDPPVYSESGDGFFDEMRLTAPWKAREAPSDSPQV